MQSEKAHEIHVMAGHARESGKFSEAIKLIVDAIHLYEEGEDWIGAADAMGDASLTLRHLYRESKDITWLYLAKFFAENAVNITRKMKVGLARPLFNLAKVQEELGDFGVAAKTYGEAVSVFDSTPQELHNRSGVLADMKVHMYTCQYKTGDKGGLEKAVGALSELEDSDEKTVSKYNYDVWVSGAHMRIAEMLKEDDLEKAKEHLEEAKEIIFSNPDLKIRKEQWEKLSSTFK